jgi:hypothetical protein
MFVSSNRVLCGIRFGAAPAIRQTIQKDSRGVCEGGSVGVINNFLAGALGWLMDWMAGLNLPKR